MYETCSAPNVLFIAGQVFRQKEAGQPMGSSISGILAILFMDKLETIALSFHLSISPCRRYVDNIYLQTTGEDMADQFHHTMNNLHPKLKLEVGKIGSNTKWPFTITTRFQSHHIKRWQMLLRILQEISEKKRYLFTTSQPYPRNQRRTSFAMSGNVSRRDAQHRQQQQNTKMHSMTSSV